MAVVSESQILQHFFGGGTVTQRQGVAGEPGVDIGLAAGTAVKAVESGVFVAGLSTPNEVVEKVQHGASVLFLDYMHIDPSSFKPGQQIKAGDVVGSITTKDEGSGGVTFGNKTYFSTGPHLEFGVYPEGQPVGQDRNPGLNPLDWLARLWGGTLGKAQAVTDSSSAGSQAPAASGTTTSAMGMFGDLGANTGGVLGFIANVLSGGATSLGAGLVGLGLRLFMTGFFLIVGTVFLFKGLGKLGAS